MKRMELYFRRLIRSPLEPACNTRCGIRINRSSGLSSWVGSLRTVRRFAARSVMTRLFCLSTLTALLATLVASETTLLPDDERLLRRVEEYPSL